MANEPAITGQDFGAFPLSDVAHLPNVTVAFPGEHWSNRKANEVIVPGEAVIPVNSGGALAMRRAHAADQGDPRLAIALREVMVPDINPGSIYNPTLGPNEIRNLALPVGAYVHAYYSGAFHLTLCQARAWVGGEMVAWDETAARPPSKGLSGTGNWIVTTDPTKAFFEVMEFRPVNASNEGILTVRSLRSQF